MNSVGAEWSCIAQTSASRVAVVVAYLSLSHTALPDMDSELSGMTDRVVIFERARSMCVEWVYTDCT